jgi:hypothetical protein
MSHYNNTQYDIPIYKSVNSLITSYNYFDDKITINNIPLKLLRDSSMYDISDPDRIYILESFINSNKYHKYLIYIVYIILFLIFFILFYTLL